MLSSYEHSRFVWGMRDCCLLIADAVEAITGHDPAYPLFRHQYWSEQQAQKLMCMFGGGVHETVNYLARELGLEEITPGRARFGDIGLLGRQDHKDVYGAVIDQNRQAFLFMDGRGALVIPRTLLSQTWRV